MRRDNVKTCISNDGDRCVLVDKGEIFASFDYGAGVAILSRAGHPEWARLDMCPEE